jgi:hypothetical protein
MDAPDGPIAKYTEPYRKLYPSSTILLVRSQPSDFFWPTTVDVKLAVRVLTAALETSSAPIKTESSSPELLIHAWSNGGSTTLARIRGFIPSLPLYTLVLDSAPGQFHYRATYTAFALSLRNLWLRRLFSPWIHFMCSYFWIRATIDKWRRARAIRAGATDRPRGPLELSSAAHNDPKWLASEVRRTYVYSDEDVLIRSSDVEAHADEAAARGFSVRKEKFTSPHVAHARADPKRYWRVAEETFEGEETEVDETKVDEIAAEMQA